MSIVSHTHHTESKMDYINYCNVHACFSVRGLMILLFPETLRIWEED